MIRFLPVLLLMACSVKAGEPQPLSEFRSVRCEGSYPHHLQGVCTDERETVFWSFTTQLVKTGLTGKVLKQVPVANHHGDLCYQDGKVYVAVNLGKFNDPQGNADSWVYVYNANDLSLLAKHNTPQVTHGAGGIAFHGDKFLVVGGLPAGTGENYTYEYDQDFTFVQKHVLPSGHTLMGIQTATFADGHWWFGCYGEPKILLKADERLAKVQRYEFDCSLGIVPIGNGRFLVGRGTSSKEGCTGRLVLAEADTERGLTDWPSATVGFRQSGNSIEILVGDKPVAEYIFRDDEILRPYFRHLRTLSGVQVTRNHPPVKGQDRDDHATMHPGLWLAFGDLNGADFWRNRAQVRHIGFVENPHGDVGSGAFAVRNAYEADGRTICTEDCEITISVQPAGYLLTWESTFRSDQDAFTFGDQEEMGLGVRVATPLAVVNGGQITDSEGRKNEPQVWGRQATWCQYGGTVNGQRVGVVLMPDVQNFRRSWFHARDYGVLVANPFGQNAFTKGEKSKVTVQKGETFRLGFGVFIFGIPSGEAVDIAAAYRAYLEK
jgi:hypothetical protein